MARLIPVALLTSQVERESESFAQRRDRMEALVAELRDRTGQISGLLWNVRDNEMARISAGDYVRVRGKVQVRDGKFVGEKGRGKLVKREPMYF